MLAQGSSRLDALDTTELDAFAAEAQANVKNQMKAELETIWAECKSVRVCFLVARR